MTEEIKVGMTVITEHYPETVFQVRKILAFNDNKPAVIAVKHISGVKHEFKLPQSTSIFKVQEATWPKSGPDFNPWNMYFSNFCSLTAEAPFEWYRATNLKYVNIRADIRADGFLLEDRDGNKIDPIYFLNAMYDRS